MTEFLRVSPPEDGLVAAMSVARGRRYRKAGLSTGAAAAALSCLALVAASAGTQTLIQEPRPELPAVTGVEELEHTETTDASPPAPNTAGSVADFSPMVGSTRSPAASKATTDQTLRDTTYTRPLLPRTESPYRAGGIRRDDNTGLALCSEVDTDRVEQLCPNLYFGTAADDDYTMQAEICSTYARRTSLEYETNNEVDFVVTDLKGRELWRWSRWHPAFDAPHFVSIDTGLCALWTFGWTGVDATGTKLPTGSYRLRAVFLADELRDRRELTRDFTIG